MELSLTYQPQSAEAMLRGQFTFSDVQQFKSVLSLVEHPEVRTITINFAQVEFVDSAALGMLMVLRANAEKHDKSVALKGAQGQVERVFRLSRFDQLFAMVA